MLRKSLIRFSVLVISCSATFSAAAQSQAQTRAKVQQLVEKKAEYHRLTNGQRDGYRIKIHFAVGRDAAKDVRTKFAADFPDITTYEVYQQPYWVVLVGDFRTKLEAFETKKRIEGSFPIAFIIKDRINPR
jgi:hypothetical protein